MFTIKGPLQGDRRYGIFAEECGVKMDRPDCDLAEPCVAPGLAEASHARALGHDEKVPQVGAVCAPALRLADLRHDQCRWPVAQDAEGHRFCGEEAVVGRSYCRAHRLRSLGSPGR